MLLARKIDCYGQLLLASVMVSSFFISLSGEWFLFGLFYLGWWQVFSALLNTYKFAQCGFTRRIKRYWMFCVGDLALFFFSSWPGLAGHLAPAILLLTSLIGAFLIAGYYWWIYHRLIGFIFLRNELDGLTKSKHS